MNPNIVFKHSHLVSDACCLINLCASDQLGSILRSLPVKVMVPGYILDSEVKSCNLVPLIEAEVINVIEPETEAEYETFVRLAAQFRADGDAYSVSMAYHRNWALATDENRILKYMGRAAPEIQTMTTPEIIKFWADQSKIDKPTLKHTLNTIAERGSFTISPRNVCFPWWKAITDDTTEN